MAKIGFVSLGCPKNLVDSEVMLGMLAREGHQITPAQAEAEILVVNTCGFIESAKQESVNAILEMAAYNSLGSCRRLIVAGCLVERYRNEILREIPEVDAVIGTNQIPEIVTACADELRPPAWEPRELYLYSDGDPRILTTPAYSAYLKIAEGCDHPCTFCVIPKMRGRFRSRSLESLAREAEGLAGQGVRELNLIAQDSTMYGRDLGYRGGLALLLRRLAEVDGVEWIRFLYSYPNRLTDDVLDAIAETSKVCKYIDMPLQSASREVLKRMKRGGNRQSLTRLIARVRDRIPDVAIRTTMIVGFPGETDDDFRELLDFVEEMEFDRLGAFAYSDEEDADSHSLDAKIADPVKQERLETLMECQATISRKKNRDMIGREYPILIEGPSSETDLLWEGRLPSQAPEIDGVVYLNDGVTEETRPGEIGRVVITEAHDYDLVGTVQK